MKRGKTTRSRTITFLTLLIASLPLAALVAWYVAKIFFADRAQQFNDQLLESFPIAVPIVSAIICALALLSIRKQVKSGTPLEGHLAYHAMLFGLGLVVYVIWAVVAVIA